MGVWGLGLELGHWGLRLGVWGVVCGMGGLVRAGFRLGWEGFWVWSRNKQHSHHTARNDKATAENHTARQQTAGHGKTRHETSRRQQTAWHDNKRYGKGRNDTARHATTRVNHTARFQQTAQHGNKRMSRHDKRTARNGNSTKRNWSARHDTANGTEHTRRTCTTRHTMD